MSSKEDTPTPPTSTATSAPPTPPTAYLHTHWLDSSSPPTPQTEPSQTEPISAPPTPQQEQEQPQQEQPQQEQKVQERVKNCSICYTDLNENNIVNTECTHVYCWECFFKWIRMNPTCPLCRHNFVSENAWYQNRDIDEDIDNLRNLSNMLQIEVVEKSLDIRSLEKRYNKLRQQYDEVKHNNKCEMGRLIRLREQLEFTRGYNDCLRGNPNDINININMELNSPWFQGYNRALFEKNYPDLFDENNKYFKENGRAKESYSKQFARQARSEEKVNYVSEDEQEEEYSSSDREEDQQQSSPETEIATDATYSEDRPPTSIVASV